MAILPIKRISITGLKEDRERILHRLQAFGAVEINISDKEEVLGDRPDTEEARRKHEKNVRLAEQALALLDIYAPLKQSPLAALDGKEPIAREDLEETIASADQTKKQARQVIDLVKQIDEWKAERARLDSRLESLKPWEKLDVRLDLEGTDKTCFRLGMLPQAKSKQDLLTALAAKDPDIEAIDVTLLSTDQDAGYFALLYLREEEARVDKALRLIGFARTNWAAEQTASEWKKDIQTRIHQGEEERQGVVRELAAMGSYRKELTRFADYNRLQEKEKEAEALLPESKNAFVISGYLTEKDADRVKKAMEEAFLCAVDIDDIEEGEDAPTVVKNNRFSEACDPVLASYGLPARDKADPTTLMSFFYVAFFGIMLSDAAYGAIMSLTCFALLKAKPHMDKGMNRTLRLFAWCGLSTVFWGVMFGGYFGDALSVISSTFFHRPLTVHAVWFEPLKDPMRLLMWSMLFGLIHLFTGLGIKGYELVRKKQYLDFFCDVVLWYAFLVGLILLLLPTEIFASISQMTIRFPEPLSLFAKVLAIGGVLGLLLMSGRDHKNPLLRLALGAYDIYNITGWLSDVLSYSRLLALGLATGVIASVINQMGSLLGGGIIGAILFVIIFVLGHTINMAINVLGAYVHTNRLQFVEFFGKFYEADGRPLEPFDQNTKYITIKEEI